MLNNLAWTYDDLGQRSEALRLYEEALPIRREVGDRAGEATTLNNMAGMYYAEPRGGRRRRCGCTRKRCPSCARWGTAPGRRRR